MKTKSKSILVKKRKNFILKAQTIPNFEEQNEYKKMDYLLVDKWILRKGTEWNDLRDTSIGVLRKKSLKSNYQRKEYQNLNHIPAITIYMVRQHISQAQQSRQKWLKVQIRCSNWFKFKNRRNEMLFNKFPEQDRLDETWILFLENQLDQKQIFHLPTIQHLVTWFNGSLKMKQNESK